MWFEILIGEQGPLEDLRQPGKRPPAGLFEALQHDAQWKERNIRMMTGAELRLR